MQEYKCQSPVDTKKISISTQDFQHGLIVSVAACNQSNVAINFSWIKLKQTLWLVNQCWHLFEWKVTFSRIESDHFAMHKCQSHQYVSFKLSESLKSQHYVLIWL